MVGTVSGNTQVLTCYSIPERASDIRPDLLSHVLKNHVQGFITGLQKAVLTPVVQRLVSHIPGISNVPPVCQSSVLALSVSSLALLEDLPPRVWLRKGEVEKSETLETSVKDILRALDYVRHTHSASRPHTCSLLRALREIKVEIEDGLQKADLPETTVGYMEKQRAKLGTLTFPTPY